MPLSTQVARVAGSCSTLRVARYSRSMMGAGVFAGAARPVHEVRFRSGSLSSANVGTSGSCDTRCGAATASARSLPLRMLARFDDRLFQVSCTWPASRSLSATPEPR